VIEGTNEVIAPVTSSVLTTLAVFVPVAFIDGIIGQYLKELALTVSVSLVTSLFVAFTVIPLLSNRMLGAAKPSGMMERVQTAYGKALTYALKRKWRTLFAFTLLLGASLYALLADVPKGFFPNITDRSLFIEYELDEKVAFETNKQLMAAAVEHLVTVNGVKDVLYWGSEQNANSGRLIVLYQARENMTRSDEEVNGEIRQWFADNFPHVSWWIGAGQADTSGKLDLSVTGASMQAIIAAGPAITEELKLIPGVNGVEARLADTASEWLIDFSPEQLAYYRFRRRPLPGRTEPVSSETHP
jgi:multidrug efflux pump subunit AcrB